MRFTTGTIFCGLLLLIGVAAWSQDEDATPPAPEDAHRTGAFEATVTERSRHSHPRRMQQRLFEEKLGPEHADYNLAEETFRVVVPESYAQDQPHGLIIWISPNESGWPDQDWPKVLAAHKLLWIGADDAGDERVPWHRLGLPFDALEHMRQRYHLDEDRIYIAGLGGGARAATRLGVTHPEVFDGVLAIGAVDFFEPIEVPNKPGFAYPSFKRPRAPILQHARQHLRLTVLIGEGHPNNDVNQLLFSQYLRHAFKHARLLEAADLEPGYPPAGLLSRVIDRLDAPLFEARAEAEQQAEGQPADATDQDGDAAARADAAAARDKLNRAREHIGAGENAQARQLLRVILTEHPDTREAKLAQAMLDALDR